MYVHNLYNQWNCFSKHINIYNSRIAHSSHDNSYTLVTTIQSSVHFQDASAAVICSGGMNGRSMVSIIRSPQYRHSEPTMPFTLLCKKLYCRVWKGEKHVWSIMSWHNIYLDLIPAAPSCDAVPFRRSRNCWYSMQQLIQLSPLFLWEIASDLHMKQVMSLLRNYSWCHSKLYLLREAVSVEGMSAWKHVESLSQQSTLTDLAPSVRLNNDTSAKDV